MKLTVFGATGGVGREIVRQGLAAGHRVTAVVRDPARLEVTGDRLDVFTAASFDDPESLRAAVAGRDAVLSGVGPRGRKDAGITAPVTRSILRAMDAEGVRRLLVVSAAPVGEVPRDEPLLGKVAMGVVKVVLKPVYVDLARMEEELTRSATDWTSVRPPQLLDKPVTGVYRAVVGANPRGGSKIGRPDLAHAMLAMIDDPATVRRPVGVAY
ncbi:NAD(P)-dependent oxidoreductase [Streptomyces sp. NPDC051217]|uniref:NAD(P)-dependent oxidoreductase n=1 Tax=Streptomyces sp. NPDC051217 TaxID=3365644 RepID=UPI0037B660A4